MTIDGHLHDARARLLSRRWFFNDCGVGLAGIAAGSLLAAEGRAAVAPPAAGRPAQGLSRQRVGRDYRLTDVHGNLVKGILA